MTHLFLHPDAFARQGLAALFPLLDELLPLNAAHRRDLPKACRDLSAALTTDRVALDRPYWASPRLTSAYLRYFLPWNLVRLTTLLPSLDLEAPKEEEGTTRTEPRNGDAYTENGQEDDTGGERHGDALAAAPLILDLGSGPLTLPIALWLSRPDLRRRPVTVVCADNAIHALDLGRRLFERLRQELDPHSPWTVRTLRAPLQNAMRQVRGRPWLLTMGNVLNEVDDHCQRQRRTYDMSGPSGGPLSGATAEALAGLLENAAVLLRPGGRLLAVEPGTRQGGRLIAGLRALALSAWDEEISAPLFRPLAPCPHVNPCPMLAARGASWCHWNAPAQDAPSPLRNLSRQAGLDKESVSLSFLLLRREGPEQEQQTVNPKNDGRPPRHGGGFGEQKLRREKARIMSDAFPLPGRSGRARYACTAQGLALVTDSAHLPSGSLCEVELTAQKDGKSGATMAVMPGDPSSERKKRFPERNAGHTGKSEKIDAETLRPESPKQAANKATRTQGKRTQRGASASARQARRSLPGTKKSGLPQ